MTDDTFREAAALPATSVARLALNRRHSTATSALPPLPAGSPLDSPLIDAPLVSPARDCARPPVVLPTDDAATLRRHELQVLRPARPPRPSSLQREVLLALEAASGGFSSQAEPGGSVVPGGPGGPGPPRNESVSPAGASLSPALSPGRNLSMLRKPTVASRSTITRNSVALPPAAEEAAEDPALARLPALAAEAVRTAAQAAEDARAAAKRSAGVDVGLTFLRCPVPRHFSLGWLRFVDALHRLGGHGMEDPHQATVFAVTSPESVFHALAVLTTWTVEHGGPDCAVGAAAPDEEWIQASVNDAVSQQLAPDMASSSSSEGRPGAARPASPWAVVQRLVEGSPRLALDDSVAFVDALLEQTNTASVVVGRIEAEMAAAEVEAAAAAAAGRGNTASDFDAVAFHACRAACALERYTLLVLLHSFAASAPGKRELMTAAAAEFTFTEFLTTHPGLLAALDTVDPWEGRDPPCPLPPTSAALFRDYRWRERLWVSRIG